MNNEITLKAFREMRKRAHVCRDCGKQDAYTLAGRTFCYDCAEKNRKSKEKVRLDPERKTRMLEQHRAMRERRKAKGLCPMCGNPVADWHVLCPKCRAKNRNYLYKSRHERGQLTWDERTSGETCFLCGKPVVKGKKLCRDHMTQKIKNLRKSNPNAVYLTTEKYLQPSVR